LPPIRGLLAGKGLSQRTEWSGVALAGQTRVIHADRRVVGRKARNQTSVDLTQPQALRANQLGSLPAHEGNLGGITLRFAFATDSIRGACAVLKNPVGFAIYRRDHAIVAIAVTVVGGDGLPIRSAFGQLIAHADLLQCWGARIFGEKTVGLAFLVGVFPRNTHARVAVAHFDVAAVWPPAIAARGIQALVDHVPYTPEFVNVVALAAAKERITSRPCDQTSESPQDAMCYVLARHRWGRVQDSDQRYKSFWGTSFLREGVRTCQKPDGY
jgi:hypothetical protein